MPWGGSERQQPACKRRQASKAHSGHRAHRLLWSVRSVAREFLAGVLGRIYVRNGYYGSLELDINRVYPLEMLRFGQREHAVTLCHWQNRQTRVSQALDRNEAEPDQGSWGDTLNASGAQCPEWMRLAVARPARGSRLTEPFPGTCCPTLRHRRNSSETTTRNKRIKLFMGRGSSGVTSPPWSCKITLWILIASLLIWSTMVTSSPAPKVNVEKWTSHEAQIEDLGPDSADNTELMQEEATDLIVTATQSSHYDNTTILRPIDDELADRLPRSVRATAESVKSKRSRKRSSKGGEDKGGTGGKSCSLKRLNIKVRDLGLGYDSDESIILNYCSGTCHETRNEYDIALTHLLERKKLFHSSHGRISNHPCCRPTGFLPISFMDVKNNWKLELKLSAAECKCVG